MSLTSWIKDIVVNHKRITACVLEFSANESTAYARLMITNKSRLPISITGISIVVSFQQCSCTALPKLFGTTFRYTSAKLIDRSVEYSTALPIHVPGLGGTTALVLFEELPQTVPRSSKYLTFVIYTNRGSPNEMTLPLPEEWASRS